MNTENQHILKGWGIDANRENDPTYPMRNRNIDAAPSRPSQQIAKIEILQSNERPRYSAVFGETIPPSGWSGQIRRHAFQYSESRYRHWLPLLLADRLQMFEELIKDLQQGKIPNLFVEMGGKAMWKYDKPMLIKKTACYVLGGIVAVCLLKKLIRK